MEKLPRFLQLVKNNIVIYSILNSGSFSILEQHAVKHQVWSDKAVELRDFRLSVEDLFSSVLITFGDLGLHIFFRTDNPKYFTNTANYFNFDPTVKKHSPYTIDNKSVDHRSKKLGEFTQFIPALNISLHQSSVYGYSINLSVIDKKAMDRLVQKSFEQSA